MDTIPSNRLNKLNKIKHVPTSFTKRRKYVHFRHGTENNPSAFMIQKEENMPLTRAHSPINDLIIYQDNAELEIIFTTFVFRVDRMIEKVDSIYAFQVLIDLPLITNGHLVIFREMNTPAVHLTQRITERLVPLGFEDKRDFTIMEEQLIFGVNDQESTLLGSPLPENTDIQWLCSVVRTDGNFVWWIG
jgi:hypothetical protein